jgi:hypothetical protein
MDTAIKDTDGSRVAIELGSVQLSKFADTINERLEMPANQVIGAQLTSEVHVFIPKDMAEEDKIKFVNQVRLGIEAEKNGGAKVNITVRPVDIDVYGIERKLTQANKDIERILRERDSSDSSEEGAMAKKVIALNKRTISHLHDWRRDFLIWVHKMKNWSNWPLEQKLMFHGSIIGLGKSALSVTFWTKETGVNAFGVAQTMMSFALDFLFARWGHRIEAWKGSHRLPTIDFPGLNKTWNSVARFYNDNPVVKAFMIDNLIGISAGAYFRLMSYLADKSGQVGAPWSVEYIENILGGMTIGSVAGAAGGQGVRTLRRKGIIGVSTEYALYQIFGLGMQIGGFLNGAAWTNAFWLFLKAEAAAKVLLWGASRSIPAKKQRILVFSDEISDGQIKNIQYQFGMYDALNAKADNTKSVLSEVAQAPSLSSWLVNKLQSLESLRVFFISERFQSLIAKSGKPRIYEADKNTKPGAGTGAGAESGASTEGSKLSLTCHDLFLSGPTLLAAGNTGH